MLLELASRYQEVCCFARLTLNLVSNSSRSLLSDQGDGFSGSSAETLLSSSIAASRKDAQICQVGVIDDGNYFSVNNTVSTAPMYTLYGMGGRSFVSCWWRRL